MHLCSSSLADRVRAPATSLPAAWKQPRAMRCVGGYRLQQQQPTWCAIAPGRERFKGTSLARRHEIRGCPAIPVTQCCHGAVLCARYLSPVAVLYRPIYLSIGLCGCDRGRFPSRHSAILGGISVSSGTTWSPNSVIEWIWTGVRGIA